MTDAEYMSKAIELAKKGVGWVNPNPLVGAVIVKDDKTIGTGWHEACGQAHAERNALENCTQSPEGATLYVTLEPCSHHGRTPPCTEAILHSGIKRVVIGSRDPNPLVNGAGVRLLLDNGIEVQQDVLRDECDRLNYVFFHYIACDTPYVVMKYAMTLDGKIATHTGASKWITGEIARRRVHASRHEYSAIMVGIGTVLADDPKLNCRIDGGKDPVRIICDSHLRTPLDSQIALTAGEIDTIILAASPNALKQSALEKLGCRIIYAQNDKGKVDLTASLRALHNSGIDSIYLEGGGTLNSAMLKEGLVKRIHAYIAPKLVGGREAPGPIGGPGAVTMQEAALLSRPEITFLGDDILLDCEVR